MKINFQKILGRTILPFISTFFLAMPVIVQADADTCLQSYAVGFDHLDQIMEAALLQELQNKNVPAPTENFYQVASCYDQVLCEMVTRYMLEEKLEMVAAIENFTQHPSCDQNMNIGGIDFSFPEGAAGAYISQLVGISAESMEQCNPSNTKEESFQLSVTQSCERLINTRKKLREAQANGIIQKNSLLNTQGYFLNRVDLIHKKMPQLIDTTTGLFQKIKRSFQRIGCIVPTTTTR